MENFEYRVTLIIPVYNVEKYIDNCLYSVVAQTIDKSEIEVLLINDGSTDNSLEICYDFQRNFDFFKVFTKENEGVSATRNFGIRHAKGKYLMYLDSDDTLTSETIENVVDFFDENYDEVDLVTYPIVPYKYNKAMPIHFRYKILVETNVYNLNDCPFISQTTMNIVVKNLLEDNNLFDTSMTIHEDQKFINYILIDKLKIGFCKEAEYQYNKSNDNSIMSTSANSIELFETATKYYEDMFDNFNNNVPQYIQAMLIHDLSWKLKLNALFPYHYDKKDFENALNRIVSLLSRVENKIISGYLNNEKFHTHFWLKLKNGYNNIVYLKDKKHLIYSNEELLYEGERIEIILMKLTIINNKIHFLAFAKSVLFNYLDEAKIFIAYNKDYKNMVEVQTYQSSYSYYKCKILTNNFKGFCAEIEFKDDMMFEILIEIDGHIYRTNYYFMPTSPFNKQFKKHTKIVDDKMIKFESNRFYCNKLTPEEFPNAIECNNLIVKKHSERIYQLRLKSKVFSGKKIWLYYDCKGVKFDNGYLQFIHDFDKNDDVLRYYISNNDREFISDIFTPKQWVNVVEFGSDKHIMLLINAEKILTAFIEDNNVFPFTKEDYKLYYDLFNFEIIYLQHGILHASMPWKYSPERCLADKVVVSSYFEQENFHKKYNFKKKNILPFGMPRFDSFNTNNTKTNRILFAPTWRKYLIGQDLNSEWVITEKAFINSKFFESINQILNSSKLQKLLEENDLFIDFKLHPIFKRYQHLFSVINERIIFAEDTIDNDQYKAFITDFSSFVFDFAYYNIPIIYFVPDMLEFKAGLNSYRELDLPFEDAFGELTETAEDTVNALEKIINNNFVLEKVYSDRMENFYLPLENCCENLYDYLINY